MDGQIKTAIIGVGRWGKNVARELSARSDLVGYATNTSELNAPSADMMQHAEKITLTDICQRADIAAVAIATPIATHAEIARTLIASGKHILCEKPLAADSYTAMNLAALAQDKRTILVTGYVFVYHPVFRKIKELLNGSTISRIEFVWKKYGTFNESIEFNLLTHHLSLAFDLLGMPENASVTKREARETECDVLETQLSYPNATVVSRIDRASQEKSHRISLETSAGVYLWDNARLLCDGAVIFETSETPLAIEIEEFLAATRSGARPSTGGTFGADVLRIHEMLG